jgi:sugar phosphate isomerase/epimerase
MRSGIAPIDAIRKLGDRIVCFHFKDLGAFGDPQAHDVPWGTGKADARGILAELRRLGFRGVFSIEYEHNWESSLPEIARCVEFFREQSSETR